MKCRCNCKPSLPLQGQPQNKGETIMKLQKAIRTMMIAIVIVIAVEMVTGAVSVIVEWPIAYVNIDTNRLIIVSAIMSIVAFTWELLRSILKKRK